MKHRARQYVKHKTWTELFICSQYVEHFYRIRQRGPTREVFRDSQPEEENADRDPHHWLMLLWATGVSITAFVLERMKECISVLYSLERSKTMEAILNDIRSGFILRADGDNSWSEQRSSLEWRRQPPLDSLYETSPGSMLWVHIDTISKTNFHIIHCSLQMGTAKIVFHPVHQ